MPARIVEISGDQVAIDLDGTLLRIPKARCRASGAGEPIWLFVRPEALEIVPEDTKNAILGTIYAHVYQGAHIEIHVEAGALGTIHLRTRDDGVMARWPVGARVGLVGDLGGAMVFPRDSRD